MDYCLNFRHPVNGNSKMDATARDLLTVSTAGSVNDDWPSSPKTTTGGQQQPHQGHFKDIFSAFQGKETILQCEENVSTKKGQTSPKKAHNTLKNRGFGRMKQKKEQPIQDSLNKIGCIIEANVTDESVSLLEDPAFVGSGSTTLREEKRHLHKSSKQLRKELQRTIRVLHCERSQKNILKERLEHLEKELDQLRREKSSNDSDRGGGAHHKKLKEQLTDCQAELEATKSKGDKLNLALDGLQKENKQLKEKMTILMFNNIPSMSPKFKDVGSVNYDIQESPGRSVGNYHLGKKLGEGHYGMVQVGMHDRSKKSYAIKVLKKDKINRFKDLQQIALEVHVLKNYQHDNIVALQDVIHAPENIYLITELCLMDLHKYHSDIGLTESASKQVVLGVLKPLHYLHSHGICHLDLKPENILIDRSADLDYLTHENVRICDFGLVNMAIKPEKSLDVIRKGYACGTPGFFAPEMILKNQFEGRIADMWSLGCIVLEITLGFTQEWMESYNYIESDPDRFKDDLEGCLKDIARERYPLHPSLLDFIHRCLTMDAKKRMKSSVALSHAWLEEIAESEENRQDSTTNSRQHGREYDPTAAYTERTKLLESAVMC